MDAGTQRARVRSVNAGRVRPAAWQGQTFTTGIFKSPVTGRRRVTGVQLDGDEQADPSAHGGPTKSLYAYAVEDYAWWVEQLGESLEPGHFGENLTIEGIDPAAAVVGERWRVGSAVLRVTEPRIPCYKLAMRMGDPRFPARFAAAARPGTYLAIDEPGDVGAGDAITVLDRPGHGLTVGDVERAYHGDHDRLPLLVDVDDLSPAWRATAEKKLAARARARARGRGAPDA